MSWKPASAKRRSISTHMSVPTTPGQYALTVMPSAACSLAAAWVRARTANLVALYGPSMAKPSCPAIDEALMILLILPSAWFPSSLNFATAAWMPHSTPSTLTAQIFATSSGVTSAIGPTSAMPAPTRTKMDAMLTARVERCPPQAATSISTIAPAASTSSGRVVASWDA